MSIEEVCIQKFKELYKRKQKKDLSDEEAFEQFQNLVTLVSAIYQPIPKKYGGQQ